VISAASTRFLNFFLSESLRVNAGVIRALRFGGSPHVPCGEQLALHALYEKTHRIVFALIVRITCNRETAEELTIDVFHDVWRRASGYDPADGTVLGWLMNQARCRAIDRVRFEHQGARSGAGIGQIVLESTRSNTPQHAHTFHSATEGAYRARSWLRTCTRRSVRRRPHEIDAIQKLTCRIQELRK
jgi:DNA-directed RNA polymerase specialized sigma24 family protein